MTSEDCHLTCKHHANFNTLEAALKSEAHLLILWSESEVRVRRNLKPLAPLVLSTVMATVVVSGSFNSHAEAAFGRKPKPTYMAWTKGGVANASTLFRFDNGDVVKVSRPTTLGAFGSAVVSVQRRGSEVESKTTKVPRFGEPRQITAPEYMLNGAGASDKIKALRPMAFENQKGKINLVVIQNANGFLIIGQIASTTPAKYFFHFETGPEFQEVPSGQLLWMIPDETGRPAGSSGTFDIGMTLGFENGRAISRTLRIPYTAEDQVVQAEKRPLRDADREFTQIAYNGAFAVPKALESQAIVTLTTDPSKQVAGVQLLRTARRKQEAVISHLKETIFGQDQAITTLANQFGETLRNGMKKPKVMIAMGPSGVGKTYIGQRFGEAVTSNPAAFLEINGNEYNSDDGSRDASKLFGTSSSVRDAQEGALILWLKANAGNGVLLINEGDKMNRSIWIKFMELLESGKISDGNGKPVKVGDLYIIITTNRGAKQMFPKSVATWTQAQIDERLASFTKDELKAYYTTKDGANDENVLPDEVMNRVDAFIPFGPLSKEAAIKVAKRRSLELQAEYQKRFLIHVDLSEEAIQKIALTGFTAANDARQIRQQVQNTFSAAIEAAERDLDMKDGSEVRISSDDSDPRKPKYQVWISGHKTSIDGLKIAKSNPLQDPELLARLTELETAMKKQVLGQDVTIHEVAEAVISHKTMGNPKRPNVMGLLGPTGNGKTETARALAQALYGSSAHLSIIPMGNVASDAAFDTIFGISAQYRGGDSEGVFEKALRENPNGGVLVFDEFTNIGGDSRELRASLMKRLYDIFEEGRYISPRDGKVFELGKYQMVLTGNEGEKLFTNTTSDDMLLTAWRNNRSESQVEKMLTDKGMPEALIGRASLWSLTKPLLSYEVDAVTRKLWTNAVADFTRENPGVKITVADTFYKNLSRAFFSSARGARSLRKVLDRRLGALLFHSLRSSGAIESNLNGSELQISIDDNFINRAFRNKGTPPRSVAFVSKLVRGGKVVGESTLDATEMASPQVLMNGKDALLTAIHEAGHAVVNIPEVTGERVAFITIRGGRTQQNGQEMNYYGYARYDQVPGESVNLNREKTILRIARYWAGRKAQELAGYTADTGWSQDLQQIRHLATQYLTTWGLDDQLIGLPLDKNGEAIAQGAQSVLLSQKINELSQLGEQAAERMLRERWSFVRSVAAELVRKGDISGTRFNEIDSKIGYKRATPNQAPKLKFVPQMCRDIFIGA